MISDKPPIEETLTQTQQEIIRLMDDLRDMLIEKNRKYGDSAMNPTRIFSRASTVEQINVRIDDKLSRILSGQVDEDEDIDKDLIGYLVLKILAKRREQVQEILVANQ